ncbi:A disintegrin and metalloproteinase with thrombospondin motifs 1-like [Tubulanus polymorphus]|uniref:A disintegrin and metalloproteinase with thrombospondin motifs 1-like n=1 Tax=Tubulanus polymorphus TaxID=672921 RepID=UPI003DA20A45
MKNGPDSVNCVPPDVKRFNPCDLLMCTNPKKKCIAGKRPPAYGTSCGNKKWCIRGKCVFNEEAPER